MPPTPAIRVLVIAPTFDNARTLRGVIDGILATGLPLLVVNDGATDATDAVLAGFGDRIDVLRHPTNQGKAAALRTGFAWAIAHGYTHAATIDTDGQHAAADLSTLVALAADCPDAMVLGVRDVGIDGYPKKNRFGRWLANALIRIEGGPRVADSQCGLRVYPLAAIAPLPVRSGRYGYETEVLTRAGWASVPTIEVNIACTYAVAGGRVSHYRVVVDTLRQIGLHSRLLAIALGRWFARWIRAFPAVAGRSSPTASAAAHRETRSTAAPCAGPAAGG